jgi:Fe-S-cluster-containing hydrogenase component 2
MERNGSRHHEHTETGTASASPGIPARKIVKIIEELCVGCEACLPLCPYAAMETRDDKVYIIDANCRGCMRCIPACPVDAIIPVP